MIVNNTTQMNSPYRTILARVELFNGSTRATTYTQHDALKSFSVDRVADEGKFFGYGICQKTNIKLVDKNRAISITTANSFKNYLSSGGEYISSFPTFYVEEVHRDENTNELSITAYDALYKATSHKLSEVGLSTPYSARDIASACALTLGLSGVVVIGVGSDETCFDAVYANGANFDTIVDEEGNQTFVGEETFREVLDAIAEATQTIYYIDNAENLVFKRLDRDGNAVLTINKNNYFTLKSSENRRLSTICRATELGNNISKSLTETGSTQYIWENPFWEARTEIEIAELVEEALAAIGGLTINQFECSWRGNHSLEIGDKIALITKDNQTVYSYLLDDVIQYTGGLSQTTRWSYTESEENPSNPTNLGEKLNRTFARVNKVDQEISIVRETTETTAEILLNEDGIVSRVNNIDSEIYGDGLTTGIIPEIDDLNRKYARMGSQVETKVGEEDFTIKVSTILKEENEIGGVKISNTNFTFNDEGLSISKSGYEMETLVNQDGMRISKLGDEVLVANNEGVSAVDLHAQTYLIVGVNSRFEDYSSGSDSKRTACFYIGGR